MYGQTDPNILILADCIDSCLVINQLSTAIAKDSLKYFFTQSCNQKEFYGVHKLKHWIDSPKFKETLIQKNLELMVDILELVESMA